MGQYDYGEIICTAIDEIVTTKLQGIQCDITKLCTVVDDTYNYQGKYVVSDGSASKFEAFSTDTSYQNNNNVLVTIPNGDFNLQKTIVGRVAATDTTPFKYTSPLNQMIKIENDLLTNVNITEKGQVANYKNSSTILKCFEINDFSENLYEGFSRLGIQADFKALLNDYDLISGLYGLKILIYADKLQTAEKIINNQVWELTFDSSEMIGNPYAFESYFTQEKVFDISAIKNIQKIEVYFYQNGKFKTIGNDDKEEFIPWSYTNKMEIDNEVTEQIFSLPPNLFVNNIKFYFGYELTKYTGETLELYPTTLDNYSYSIEDNEKQLTVRWIHQNKDKSFTLLKLDDIIDSEVYEIQWYKYHYGYKDINEYAGANWEPIEPLTFINEYNEEKKNYFNCKFLPDVKNQTEEIKVVGLIKEPSGTKLNKESKKYSLELQKKWDEVLVTDNIEEYIENQNKILEDYFKSEGVPEDIIIPAYTITNYTSNIVVLRNMEKVVDALTYDASTALSIQCEDGSEGNYFIYDQNGKINDEGAGRGKVRKFKALYKGSAIETNASSLGKIDYIKWYLPFDNDNIPVFNITNSENNTHTMIIKTPDLWEENGGKIKNLSNQEYLDISLNDGVDYIGIKRFPDDNGKLIDTQSYMIKNYWSQQDSNNTIRCELSINGTIYKAAEHLQFGRSGTNGTNTTFVLEMINGKNALVINKTNQEKPQEIQVRAILYDGSGKIINLSQDEYKNIKWSWYKETTFKENTQQEPYMILKAFDPTETDITGQIVSIICNTTSIPDDNYYILKAEYGTNPTLQAFLPIPLKTSNVSQIEGAREVLYNHQGKPSYYTDAYVIYDKNYNEIKPESDEWILTQDEEWMKNENPGMAANYLPVLKNIQRGANYNYQALQASSFYASGFNDKVCVSYNNGEYGWSQPILIMQSQYDFAMLNQWDGSLTLDQDNGTILSTMLGAGHKDSENKFSGVLIGDIATGTNNNNTETQTGVYGLHQGVISYALKEDGTATFGKAGKGQIKIDGNSGEIYSPNYYNSSASSGMLINLDYGEININNNGYKKIHISPRGDNNHQESYLSIYGPQDKSLIEIGDNQYFLRSYNKALNPQEGKGTLFDLETGTLSIQGSGGKISLSGDDNSNLFEIKDKFNHTLLLMNDENYYLKSSSFDGDVPLIISENSKEYYLYSNIKPNIQNGNNYDFKLSQIIGVYNDEVYQILNLDNTLYGEVINGKFSELNINTLDVNQLKIGEKIEFVPTTLKLDTGITDGSGEKIITDVVYTEKEYQDWFISTLNIILKNEGSASGLNIDLMNGKIDGHNLYLKGRGSKGDFVLDSGAQLTPLQIGKKFKVNWDGTLYCETVNYLGNKPPKSTYVINMNDNFYVTKGGGVGASSMSARMGNFGGGWFGGTAQYAKMLEGTGIDRQKYVTDVIVSFDGINIILNISYRECNFLTSGAGESTNGTSKCAIISAINE